MNCPSCNAKAKKFGKDRQGHQRFRCLNCKKTFIESYARPLGDMRLPLEKAVAVVQHLVEGCSIRITERITGVEKRTILALLARIGPRCARLLEQRVRALSVKDVECDEVWGWVGMKEKTKKKNGKDSPQIGDAWCFVGMECHTKLILAWHLGRRTEADTVAFTEKLAHATQGPFQISTDGFPAYRNAVALSLGAQRVDFAQVVKVYAQKHEDEARYSPADCVGICKCSVHGNPDMARAGTSRIERQNLSLRMGMRRMTRLSNAFSKKWANLQHAYALQFAFYNFCRVHQTLRVSPAVQSGITDHIWTISELILATQ